MKWEARILKMKNKKILSGTHNGETYITWWEMHLHNEGSISFDHVVSRH